MKDSISIGNAGGYWGDDPDALKRQVEGGNLDYITMDFLAEITMSIMQKQRSRDPSLGYARDFIKMLDDVLETALKKGITIITNAGGVNPEGCAKAIAELAKAKGLNPKIAVVKGDDILADLDELRKRGASLANMETGESFDVVDGRIQSANIYFGADPVVKALANKPDIVVTGRVTDTGITLAAMMHEFGWTFSDYDKLASGIVAGHMIECGTQATGGNFTDWHLVENYDLIGFPIVEMKSTGDFTITKHPGSGGLVSLDTVREQLFYEMGAPKAYITPDVIADFSTIQLEADGKDRVKVSGIKGNESTPLYKVSMAYEDGFKVQGEILVSGPKAREKATKFSEIFWQRIEHLNLNLIATDTEFVGWNACHRSLVHNPEGNEIILRLSARSESETDLRTFAKMVPSLILGGPPGVAVLGGLPRVQEVVSYWPALLSKELAVPETALYENGELTNLIKCHDTPIGQFDPSTVAGQVAESANQPIEKLMSAASDPSNTSLSDICLARSGDKGDTCNIGVLARSEKAYEFIVATLTAQQIKNWFQELCFGPVTRYELPKLSGINFLLDQSLGGGGTKTLRTDAQGKTFAQALLRQRLVIPKDVLDSVR